MEVKSVVIISVGVVIAISLSIPTTRAIIIYPFQIIGTLLGLNKKSE